MLGRRSSMSCSDGVRWRTCPRFESNYRWTKVSDRRAGKGPASDPKALPSAAAMNARSLILVLGLLVACASVSVHPQPGRADPIALDFTAVDAFWRVQA